ncbi:MAG TPA: MerR family DNA-binding transcriptional regulator [Lactobacillaceae bacterium]|jgi:DNA-binding transcriptional MerR regulator
MKEKSFLSMKEVMIATNLSRDTLRYYEAEDLIGPIRRLENGYRAYTLEDVNWLYVIDLMRGFEVPIRELKGKQHTTYQERKIFLQAYQAKIEQKIQHYQNIQRKLNEKVNFLDEIIQAEQ